MQNFYCAVLFDEAHNTDLRPVNGSNYIFQSFSTKKVFRYCPCKLTDIINLSLWF